MYFLAGSGCRRRGRHVVFGLLFAPAFAAPIARGFISKESASSLTQNGFRRSIDSCMVAHGDADASNGK